MLVTSLAGVRAASAYDVHYLQPNTNVSGAGGSQYFGDVSPPNSETHAVMWSDRGNVITDLHPPGHVHSSGATTDGFTQVGGADGHAALWHGTAASFVDLNPAGFAHSFAWGGHGGQQVGVAYVNDFFNSRPMLWTGTAASAVDLTPANTNEAWANDTDGTHQVGHAYLPGTAGHAVAWQGTAASMVDLHPTDGWFASRANAIADGNAVGWVNRSANGQLRATIWNGVTAAGRIDVHPGAEYSSSSLDATNGTEHAGYAIANIKGAPPHAFVWDEDHPLGFDLHSLLPPEFYYSQATGIDENADVVGFALRQTPEGNEFVSLVWTVPEPRCSLAAMMATAVLMRRVRPPIVIDVEQ